jgi:hypothetical protein
MMNKNIFRIAATATLFVIALIILACQDPQNTNQNTSRVNVNAGQAVNDPGAIDADCSGTADEKKIKVRDGVKGKIDGNGKLKPQYDRGLFKYDVTVTANGKLEMTVNGVIEGEGTMEDLSKALKPYVKKGCVQKVTFDLTSASALAAGFVWLVCEAPNIPCPNGECAPACPMLTPAPGNTTTNSNTGNKAGN